MFTLIGEGRPTVQIAKELRVSIKTIESHRQNIKHKLNFRNAAELTHAAIRWVLKNEKLRANNQPRPA